MRCLGEPRREPRRTVVNTTRNTSDKVSDQEFEIDDIDVGPIGCLLLDLDI